jgi:predicted O-methyltransferase YrrM
MGYAKSSSSAPPKAWTAISLALAQNDRRMVTYDPVVQNVRERYLSLVPRSVRERITFVDRPGEAGPYPHAAAVDLLFIDASHEREATIRQYDAWRPALARDAVVLFDDYGHPDFPGVRQAVRDLGLDGHTSGLLFIHRCGPPLDQF